jgi:hypothetical protein
MVTTKSTTHEQLIVSQRNMVMITVSCSILHEFTLKIKVGSRNCPAILQQAELIAISLLMMQHLHAETKLAFGEACVPAGIMTYTTSINYLNTTYRWAR